MVKGKSKIEYNKNMDFISWLQILFIAFKLSGIITWSWWWVMLPAYGGLFVLLIIVIIAAIVSAFK